MLREIWAVEMQEKKEREERERQRQKELDILDDERIRREIEEEKLKEEQENQRKKEKEKKILEENAQLLQNKKNIIENGNDRIDYNQDQFNNDNNYQAININPNSNSSINNISNYLYNKQFIKNIDLNNIHFYRNKNNNMKIKQNNSKKRLYNNIMNNRKVNEFEFAPNPRELDDSKNPQISKLKKEVNSGYMEISSLFKQLKNNVIEANQNKNRAEKELKYITDEINKEKMYHLQLEKKKYDQMKPQENYNNYYASIRDVDPIYHIKKENNIKENNMSNLAKVGQNLIRLTAQSEFIPIGSNNYENNYIIDENKGLNENDLRNDMLINEDNNNNLEIESETIFQPNENSNF